MKVFFHLRRNTDKRLKFVKLWRRVNTVYLLSVSYIKSSLWSSVVSQPSREGLRRAAISSFKFPEPSRYLFLLLSVWEEDSTLPWFLSWAHSLMGRLGVE